MTPPGFTQRLQEAVQEMRAARQDLAEDRSGSDATFHDATVELQEAAQLAWRILTQQETNR